MALSTERSDGGGWSQQLRSAREEALAMRGEVSNVAAEMQRLMQLELELAQAEMNEARGHATKGAAFGAIAGVLGLLTIVFLFLAIMFALETAMAFWAAALITAGIAALVMALAGLMAKMQISRFSPVPQRFIRTMQEDLQWARSQIKSNAR